jgi:hypothetical protein
MRKVRDKTNPIPQSPDDLKRHLREQLGFLEASARAYDQGNIAEAKRIATSLRVLLHDTSKSKSLLGQLDMKGIQFLDTSLPREIDQISSFSGLIEMEISRSGVSRYRPLLDGIPAVHRRNPFDEWWNTVIFADKKGSSITRSDLVLSVANQDGGVHVDPTMVEAYGRLSRREFLEWKSIGPSDDGTELRGAESAALRQIAHEVLAVLAPDYRPPSYVGDPGTATFAGVSVVPLDPSRKIGRNKNCPCGSGKKYKKCCGSLSNHPK